MVEQGKHYSKKHQAWWFVRQIGQQQMQCTPGLVNLSPSNQLIEHIHLMNHSHEVVVLGVLHNAANWDMDRDQDQVYDTIFEWFSPTNPGMPRLVNLTM